MTLPVSGQLSLNAIRAELGEGTSNVSLKDMHEIAFNTGPPYPVSDFYGYAHNNRIWVITGFIDCFSTTTTQVQHNGAGTYPVVGNVVSELYTGNPLASGTYAVSLTQGGTVYQTMFLGGRGAFPGEVSTVNIC